MHFILKPLLPSMEPLAISPSKRRLAFCLQPLGRVESVPVHLRSFSITLFPRRLNVMPCSYSRTLLFTHYRSEIASANPRLPARPTAPALGNHKSVLCVHASLCFVGRWFMCVTF